MSEGLSDDLLPGDQVDHTLDLADVAVDAWQTLTGLLLAAPPVDLARRLLARLPPHVPDPVHRWWLAGVRRNVEALVIPTPTTAADAAIRADYEPPPALRGHVVSSGWELVAGVTAVPLACAQEFVGIIRASMIRRSAELAGQRITSAAWRGDLDSLAELVQVEAGAVLALLAVERAGDRQWLK